MPNFCCPGRKNRKHQKAERPQATLTQADLSELIKKHVQKEINVGKKKNTNKDNFEEFKIMDENVYLNKRIENLETQIILLTEISSDEKKENLTLKTECSDKLKLKSEIHIDTFVKEILNDPDTNIGWMPDAVESRLYKNVSKVALKAIEKVLQSSHMTFMGHKLSFVLDQEEIDISNKDDE